MYNEKYKVIFHIDEIEKSSLVLSNISNLILDLGEENLDFCIVVPSGVGELVIKQTDGYAYVKP